MATALSGLCGSNGSYCPYFEKKLIEDKREDGYWLEAFQASDECPIGLVGYGLTKGEINFYSNPCTTTEPEKPIHIQQLVGPVSMDKADLTGNGLKDIIICYQYGNTMVDCDPDGGKIVWLENPGENIDKKFWTMHYIGRSTAMHRLKVGHFTQTKRWEIIGLPIVSKPHDLLSPVPVLLFQQPDNVFNVTEWPCQIINNEYFHLIHDAKVFNANPLDQLLIASREGINWFYFNQRFQRWTIENIGDGEQEEKQQTTYYGCACVDAGKVGNDSFAYIATVDPFHGNVVSVYVKTTNNYLKRIQWKRYVLDVYGYPNEHGEGPAHHLICADFDKDGDDEFLIALRGPNPNQGVYYYKPIDLSRGLFAKWKVSDDSAARIAVADFDNDGLLDFATIGYYVPGYYETNNPSISIYYNRFANKNLHIKKHVQITMQNNELLFRIPRANRALEYQILPFLKIDEINLSFEIIPPHSSRQIDNHTYVKVLYGKLIWTDSSMKLTDSIQQSRTFLAKAKSVSSLAIQSDDNRITTDDEGAVVIVMTTPQHMNEIPRFDSIEKVFIENTLPEYCSEETRQFKFKFIRCDQYDWGKQFKDLQFYNMKGIQINFADNDEQLCHIQLWAAGQGINCGVHNHSNNLFCEVHACIINGTGKGGMQYVNDSNKDEDPLNIHDSDFNKLIVPSFSEHGPLWNINAQGKPILRENGFVLYPWHKWQSGTDGLCNQSFDIWMAFEFNIQLSTIPQSI